MDSERSANVPGGAEYIDNSAASARQRAEKGRVLIVEDEPAVAEVLAVIVERCELAYQKCSNAELAMRAIRCSGVDLILLDLCLPDLPGLELLRQIRGSGCDVPVIVVTAVRDIDTKVALLGAGADDFITKPFDLQELELRIRAVLRRSVNSRLRVLFGGRLELDPARRTVSSRGIAARLTAIEFGLLWFLCAHPTEYVRSLALCSEVLDDADGLMLGTLKTHINHLRLKLATISTELRVETRRDTGYRILM